MNNVNNREKISFIIPVLNGEKYVNSCLNSITSQMTAIDELIVLDNGSTDNTITLIKNFKNAILLQSDAPTIAALRNFGVANASGDIFAFIDIDCVLSNSWRVAVDRVLSDSSIAATGSLYDLPENRSWIEAAWWSSNTKKVERASYMVGGNFIIRKDVFNALNGFDPGLTTDEDYDIGARLNKQGYILIDDPEISAVHLGNPKNLGEFIKKEKWHSESILNTMLKHGLDKPMLMTFAFIFFSIFSLIMAIYGISTDIRAILFLSMILIVPLATAIFRILHYSEFRFFLPLTLLYLLFYTVRSITLMESILNKIFKPVRN